MMRLFVALLAVLSVVQAFRPTTMRFAQNRAATKLNMMADGPLVITAAMVPTVSPTLVHILEHTFSSFTRPPTLLISPTPSSRLL